MNNLVYSTNIPEIVAPQIEEILRADLGLTMPLTYKIDLFEENKPNTLGKINDSFFGGAIKPIFSVTFEINQPRNMYVTFLVKAMGLLKGSSAFKILFHTKLRRSFTSLISFEEPRFFGTSKFKGDANEIEKLNANIPLRKLVDTFARVRLVGAETITISRYVKIEQSESGADLEIATLPRLYDVGSKATTDAKMFIEIATMIENTL